jgi:hypothetical protein
MVEYLSPIKGARNDIFSEVEYFSAKKDIKVVRKYFFWKLRTQATCGVRWVIMMRSIKEGGSIFSIKRGDETTVEGGISI